MKKFHFVHGLVVLVSVFFVMAFLPSVSSASGTIKLNPGATVTLSSADVYGQGGGCQLPKVNCSGASSASPSGKSIRVKTIATLSGKGSYSAKVGERFYVARGDSGQTYGRARITISGISYYGTVGALGIAVPPPWALLGILIAISLVTGAGFGIYPSIKASRLHPVDALRE